MNKKKKKEELLEEVDIDAVNAFDELEHEKDISSGLLVPRGNKDQFKKTKRRVKND
jgi:hypothetical protein